MAPHLRLKGPVFCQALYQHDLLSRVSVRLLSSATSTSSSSLGTCAAMIWQRMEDLSNEILLHVFWFLPPKTLMAGRSASQERRAHITPMNQALLDFYFHMF